jgi:hypothetical protein
MPNSMSGFTVVDFELADRSGVDEPLESLVDILNEVYLSATFFTAGINISSHDE